MSLTDERSPGFSEEDAVRLAEALFGLRASARPLPSYLDQNFHLEDEAGRAFVLKIAHASEKKDILDLQNQALDHLAISDPALPCPRVCAGLNGEKIAAAEGPARTIHFVRMVTYLPGVLFVDVHPHSPELLRSLGRFLARLDRALEGFDHPAARRTLQWDLANAPGVLLLIKHIEDPSGRALVERRLARFEQAVAPALPKLRRSVIHNDGNDYNLLVNGPGAREREVTGILDFGDMVHTCTVFELAVAAAYAILDKQDPLAAAAQVAGGYHELNPLKEEELDVLHPLLCTRLAVSVALSAQRKKLDPENRYLEVTEGPAWEMLHHLESVSPDLALYTFRHACGFPPCPQAGRLEEWLKRHALESSPVLDADLSKQPVKVFDLGVGSLELCDQPDRFDPGVLEEYLFRRIREADAKAGVGRYNEVRRLHTGPAFTSVEEFTAEGRTVHLGMDLFVPPDTPIRAPLDGTVHSFGHRAPVLDYGPTLVLEHETGGAEGRFYTLYGHLSESSLDGLRAGAPVKKGDCIARVGKAPSNGNWPPHLHFQIICDLLGFEDDFPRAAPFSQRALWLDLCPDPNLILGIPGEAFPPPELEPEAILARRRRFIGPSLSLSYDRPLKIVRGAGCYLFDHTGRAYLDGVNNVCHVGHCHPRVVQAAREQMAVLNTNTRYLHDLLVRYAERLAARFPDPLKVCFLVCTGSEANELALRLARTRTQGEDLIVLDGAYHGHTTALIDASPYKHDGPGGRGPPSHVHKVPAPDTYRGPYKANDPSAGEKYAAHVREALDRIRREGRRPAGFLCEPLMGCGGQIVPPDGYLEEAFRHVRDAGGVCIADEVQVGFGRVGSHFWGFQAQGAVPDIVTLGKPIGNGHPLAAVVTTPGIAESFDNGMEYFNTFGGNPVSCRVGLAVLDVIEEERLMEHALEVGSRLKAGLEALKERHTLIGDVRGKGLFLGIELVLDRSTLAPAPEQASYIVERSREYGVLLSIDGPLHNVIKIKPPLVFSELNADYLVRALDRILAEDFCKTD